MLKSLTKDKRRVILIIGVLVFFGLFLSTMFSTVDYSDVTVTITTSQGLQSTLEPNPVSLDERVAWDNSDLTVRVKLEMPEQVLTIDSFSFYVKETGFDPVTYEYVENIVASQSSYTTSENILTAQTVISDPIHSCRDEGQYTYYLYVDIYGVDYREEFHVYLDYFYFICATPDDYYDYYGDTTTTITMTTETDETTTITDTTTTTTTTMTTETDEITTITDTITTTIDNASGFEIILLIFLIPIIIYRRKQDD